MEDDPTLRLDGDRTMRKKGKILGTIVLLAGAAAAAIVGLAFYFSSSSIHSLLTENHELNKAIRNLTEERQIGYATVLSRESDQHGRTKSLVRFVQTAPGNPDQIVSEQLFEVTGSVIHFDALIVKFSDAYVREGKGRSLYLWRRIYGDQTAPENGEAIQDRDDHPERYAEISRSLRLKDREVFWEAIWDLAENPAQLSQFGVTAIYGNAIYTRMEPGQVYLFKISPTGQIYPKRLSYQ
ncbi:MAG: hypothetical protein ACLFS1_05900 [Opitutales bacterium]